MSQRPFVSVIIPVLNSSQSLKTCLNALESQTYPKDLFEVIVVDNGSRDDIKELVSKFSQAIFTSENKPSSYAARNKGLSLAKGDVLAFTDADCVPALDWIEKGVATLYRLPRSGMVAGRVECFFEDPNKLSSIELYDSLVFFEQKLYVEEGHFGMTANLFTSKKVMDEVGCFDGSLISGGDVKWGNLVYQRGYAQIYAEDVYVAHPARRTFKELREKVIRVTGGHHEIYHWKNQIFKDFFVKSFRDLLRNGKAAVGVFCDKRLHGLRQKTQFFLVLVFIKFTGAYERIRLRMGGKPRGG